MRTAGIAALGLALTLAASPATWAADATELAILPGSYGGGATGVNDHGVTVGYSMGNPTRAVTWDAAGAPSTLPVPAGKSSAWADAINNDGVIVGAAGIHPHNPDIAVRWNTDGTVIELGDLGGGTARAVSINASGVAAGFADTTDSGRRAVRWGADGSASVLAPLPGDTDSYASGINAAGVVVGWSKSASDVQRAVRWNADGTVTQLSTGESGALAISDAGVITGYVGMEGMNNVPAQWSADGAEAKLPVPAGRYGGSARITADGVVYGHTRSTQDGNSQGTVWGANGPYTLPDLPGGKSSMANGLNASGVAVGWATNGSGDSRPVRWNS